MQKVNIFSKNRLFLVAIMGVCTALTLGRMLMVSLPWKTGIGLCSAIFFYIMLSYVITVMRNSMERLHKLIDDIAVEVLLGGMLGLLLGVMVGFIGTYPLSAISGSGRYIIVIVLMVCGYLGMIIGGRRALDVLGLLPVSNTAYNGKTAYYKVLDTSAIIDGRIYDVCLSNFIDGPLIAPTFVIEELQHIADSSDNIRRNKGRRGLELLSKMQKHPNIKIDIIETSVSEEKDVDGKLISLCKKLKAGIITNDYNLNKVAELQGIQVLNINELTNAVKMVVYPGETMRISIIKEGKELGQGVGYLEDGTMVVVEDAQNEIGNELEVVVTSVFQTAAGRMIFTRRNREERDSLQNSLPGIQEVNLYG